MRRHQLRGAVLSRRPFHADHLSKRAIALVSSGGAPTAVQRQLRVGGHIYPCSTAASRGLMHDACGEGAHFSV